MRRAKPFHIYLNKKNTKDYFFQELERILLFYDDVVIHIYKEEKQ